jgi:hypothetical protein
MRLISAELASVKKVHTCTCCMGAIEGGQQHWVEVWSERGRAKTERYHVQCPGEKETRQQFREGLLEYLANDPG